MTPYRTVLRRSQLCSQPNGCYQPNQQRFSAPGPTSSNATTIASQALSKGYGRMSSLNVTVRCSSSSAPELNSHTDHGPTSSPLLSASPQTSSPAPTSTEDLAQYEQRELEEDRKDAERELQRYEEAGVSSDLAERTTDLVRFWEVRTSICLHNMPVH